MWTQAVRTAPPRAGRELVEGTTSGIECAKPHNSDGSSPWWWGCGVAALLLLLPGWGAAVAQELSTTSTHYSYNADGALTAVTTQVDDQAPATTYLTWDNFVPSAADPTTGTTAAGDGNLASYGPAPGSASQAASFDFDRRDRLVGYANAQHSIVYDHHATGLMASATLDGSPAWRFYYNSTTDPQVTNIYEPSTQRWSGYLGSARFVSDGGEQVLEKPRRDLVCEYDPQTQSVQAHTYDAYGAQANATPAEGYDLSENPFQYAGEFRDPLWGGIYLRARWYDPDFPIFVSRDPMPGQLNHYGYAGGNPVMNSDPSGTDYHPLKSFKRRIDRATSGIGGHFARTLGAPFFGPLELAAHPGAFWKQIRHNKAGIDIFLAAGAAAEFIAPEIAPEWFNAYSLATRFSTRLETDVALGFGQSATQAGLTKGFKHFKWHTFLQGGEYTMGGIGWTRFAAGVGYRPFGFDSDQIESFVAKQQKYLADGDALIFRVQEERSSLELNYKGRKAVFEGSWTSPWQEAGRIGTYHERIIAVTNDDVYSTEFFNRDLVRENEGEWQAYFKQSREHVTRYQFVGHKTGFNAQEFLTANPRGLGTAEEYGQWKELLKTDPKAEPEFNKYNKYRNNCQDHAFGVLKLLGMR